jgi:hypothetical protein
MKNKQNYPLTWEMTLLRKERRLPKRPFAFFWKKEGLAKKTNRGADFFNMNPISHGLFGKIGNAPRCA